MLSYHHHHHPFPPSQHKVLNVFFIVSGANFLHLIQAPRRFFEILGTEIPLVATYASTIIIVKLLAGLPLYLLRVINILRTAYLHLATNTELRTSRDWRRGASLPPVPLYGNLYPSMLMTMLLAFTYSVLAPFVCIFAVMFFAAAGFIFKFLGLCKYYRRPPTNHKIIPRKLFFLYDCFLFSSLFANPVLSVFTLLKCIPRTIASLLSHLIMNRIDMWFGFVMLMLLFGDACVCVYLLGLGCSIIHMKSKSMFTYVEKVLHLPLPHLISCIRLPYSHVLTTLCATSTFF